MLGKEKTSIGGYIYGTKQDYGAVAPCDVEIIHVEVGEIGLKFKKRDRCVLAWVSAYEPRHVRSIKFKSLLLNFKPH